MCTSRKHQFLIGFTHFIIELEDFTMWLDFEYFIGKSMHNLLVNLKEIIYLILKKLNV